MMAVIDFHILTQAILYFCLFVCGFAVSIPIGVARHNFQGFCILYEEVNWINSSYFNGFERSKENCNFPIYFSVFGLIFYGLGVGGYNVYAVLKSRKDPTIGSQMWVMPFILLNTCLGFTTFVVACMLSVGYKTFCDGITKNIYSKETCSIGETLRWRNLNTGKTFSNPSYNRFFVVAQVAAWTCFFIWAFQVGLGILRFIRNRRQRSKDLFNAATESEKTPDTSRIAELTPKA